MKKSTSLCAAALASALALAGCATGGSLVYGTYYSSYSTTIPRVAKSEGPVPVSVTGGKLSPADVVGAMNARPNVYQLKFTTDPKTGPSGYRIALAFDNNAANACVANQAGAYPWPPSPGKGRVSAALCRFGGLISQTSAVFAEPAAANVPGFEQLMSDIVNELLPFVEPDRLGGNGCNRNNANC
jgi:hypothetical protein